jgi:hypothetical protein
MSLKNSNGTTGNEPATLRSTLTTTPLHHPIQRSDHKYIDHILHYMVVPEFSLVFQNVNDYTVVVTKVSHLRASGKDEHCLLYH